MRMFPTIFSVLAVVFCSTSFAQTAEEYFKLQEISARLHRANLWLLSVEGKEEYVSGSIRTNISVGIIRFHFNEIGALLGDSTKLDSNPFALTYSCRPEHVPNTDNVLRTWLIGFRTGLGQNNPEWLDQKEPLTDLLIPDVDKAKTIQMSGSSKLTAKAISLKLADAKLVAKHSVEIEKLLGVRLQLAHDLPSNAVQFSCPAPLAETAEGLVQAWISGFECGCYHDEKAKAYLSVLNATREPSILIDMPLHDLRRPPMQKMLDTLYRKQLDEIYWKQIR